MNIGTGNANFECANTATGGSLGGIFPVAPFSAFHLLRNYNYLVGSRSSDFVTKQFFPHIPSAECPVGISEVDDKGCLDSPPPIIRSHAFGYNHYDVLPSEPLVSKRHVLSPPCGSLLHQNYRRQRGEKKPIPDEQKDDKYFERRRRNNQAAKKSRDARKQREDQIALRATLLEHENALLKAQLLTVREEASSLRQLLLEKKTLEFTTRNESL
ncbi:Basic region leucine zipper [Popillia japonica]|uniref:Basic region leucine zipper n=1 Tax=Popillia japonica TaxID=7064 RepID=A0AAW1KQ98_POPJA